MNLAYRNVASVITYDSPGAFTGHWTNKNSRVLSQFYNVLFLPLFTLCNHKMLCKQFYDVIVAAQK